jgi:hypothetical protein
MSTQPIQPKVCPLCGSNLITPTLCDTLLSAHFRGMACPSEGVVAYHCEGSHVFLVLRDDFRWGEPISTPPDEPYEPQSWGSLGRLVRQHVSRTMSACSGGILPLLNSLLFRGTKIQPLDLA